MTKPLLSKCPKCGSDKVWRKTTVKSVERKPTKKMLCSNCKHVFYIDNPEIKRLIILSDLHCGHNTGLTPPAFQITYPEPTDHQKKLQDFRRESWIWFKNQLEKYKPYDVAIYNGDLIDGRQEKSGGSELIEASRIGQCNMAVEIIKTVNGKQNYISRGTGYHTGKLEQWENIIAENTNSHIDNIIKLDINGCLINAKHHTGRSTIPHGRFTSLGLKAVWEDLKVAGTQLPKVNIIIRSHVHYQSGIFTGNNRIVFTTPALQGETNYGDLVCEGIVDYGFTVMDIFDDGSFSHPNFINVKQNIENKYMKI